MKWLSFDKGVDNVGVNGRGMDPGRAGGIALIACAVDDILRGDDERKKRRRSLLVEMNCAVSFSDNGRGGPSFSTKISLCQKKKMR